MPAEGNGNLQTLICVLVARPDNVSHCRFLSPDKTEWRLISATLCGWRCFFVADQLWLMTRIREEEEDWQIWRGCHTSVDSGDLSEAPPTQSVVCSTCIIPVPPANCRFIWMASTLAWVPPNLSRGDSRPYAVLQRRLDKDCRQAEEPKQLVDEARRFHLGRQRQHSAGICSGALLFSSRALRPSLVTLCSHKSGRCAVELYHAPYLWYPLFYISPMASSALQHWTSPTKKGCHLQAGGENRQTWQLASPAWYP